MSAWLSPVIAIALAGTAEGQAVRLELEPGLECGLERTIGGALLEQQVRVASGEPAAWALAVRREGEWVSLRITNPEGVVRGARVLKPTRADCPALPRSVALLVKSWLGMQLGAGPRAVKAAGPSIGLARVAESKAGPTTIPRDDSPRSAESQARAAPLEPTPGDSPRSAGPAPAPLTIQPGGSPRSAETKAPAAPLTIQPGDSPRSAGSQARLEIPPEIRPADAPVLAGSQPRRPPTIPPGDSPRSAESKARAPPLTEAEPASRSSGRPDPAATQPAERAPSTGLGATHPAGITAEVRPSAEFFVARPGPRQPRDPSTRSLSAMLAGGGALGAGDAPVALGRLTVEWGFLEPWGVALDAGLQTERLRASAPGVVSVSLRWATLSLRRAFFTDGAQGLHLSLGVQLVQLAATARGFSSDLNREAYLPAAAASVEWRQALTGGLFLLARFNAQVRRPQTFSVDNLGVLVNVPAWAFGLEGGVGWSFR